VNLLHAPARDAGLPLVLTAGSLVAVSQALGWEPTLPSSSLV